MIGRFGAQLFVNPFRDAFADGHTVHADPQSVAFVFVPNGGLGLATSAQTPDASAVVQKQHDAREIPVGPNVTAFLWHPPTGAKPIRFTP